MDPNSNDSTFAADADADQQFQTHENNRRRGIVRPHRASGSADENAPLLSNEASNGRQSLLNDTSSEAVEWFGTAELQGLPWWNRPSIYWLLPPFLLFTLAFGGIVIPKLNLIYNLLCDDYYASRSPENQDPISSPMDPGNRYDRCQNPDVASRSSLFLLYGSLISGIIAAFTSPKIGAMSDLYGRKKLMVFTTCGLLVSELLTILAAKYPQTVDVNWILVGYAIDGLCGTFIVGMALAHSYATDCTSPQKRNVAFGYFHACLFTGIAVGPVLAGYIIKQREPIVGKTEAVLIIFYLALGAHTLFIFFLFFVIPESLTESRQQAARESRKKELERLGPSSDIINRLRSINFLSPLKILYPTGPGSSPALRRNLILLAATDTIMFSIAMSSMGVITIYVRAHFNWQEWETSKFVSVVNASRVLSLLVILPLITRIVRGRSGTSGQSNSGSDTFDLSIIRIAILFDMLGYLGFSLVTKADLFTIPGVIASLGGMGSPTLGSALTKHIPPDRVGQLLGATGLLHAMSRVVGPAIFNGIYSATTRSFDRTVFICLTATFGLAFCCSWFVKPHGMYPAPQTSPSKSNRSHSLSQRSKTRRLN
ncbi:tetracycline-efflux transporter-like protein [Aaosphaeria arxii CBS 175.79]|uniref:Tetracycline-efflux transporter-like protein n=1 Tax=Aaosphaeria arxii CBS 175.79 TaxID=1450172 RepID=A0A6A5XR37_9PLEO|nr:tetracycline-efflux transporter-like protein [Aaosphaeria arxii CBS 175.79]KAF2015221.1 tetracycline-efflux transporter-like protein [Aaosphaeria arxii CBS 175.79]